jgi:hypothetical protein
MKRRTRSAAFGLVLAGMLTTAPAAIASPPGHAQPSYTCSIDSYGKVLADWLKVHTYASVSAPTVGQVPYGSYFHYCSSSGTNAGGYYWVYGYGYNGSTKLTGWVVFNYLAHP